MRALIDRLAARVRGAVALVAGMSHRSRDDLAMDEEMAFHVDMQTEKNRRRGMSPAEARRAALVGFGGRSRWRDEARDERRSRLLDDFAQDVSYGVAMLRRAPGFAATAITTIA